MKFSKSLLALSNLLLFSCSTKMQKSPIQNGFRSSIDQIKPSEKTNIHKVDFLKYSNADNFEYLLKENKASFVVFGMVSNDYSDFEKKYGIKVKTENCVISPGISQLATLNNQIISNYLNEKFTNAWKADLQIIPFGLN